MVHLRRRVLGVHCIEVDHYIEEVVDTVVAVEVVEQEPAAVELVFVVLVSAEQAGVVVVEAVVAFVVGWEVRSWFYDARVLKYYLLKTTELNTLVCNSTTTLDLDIHCNTITT